MAQTVTSSIFDAMLKQYAPNELFREELIKRDWLLQNVEKDDTWLGGELLVPFKGATASSIKAGSLTAAGSISSSKYVKGMISVQPEVWGSLIFREKDLMRHGKINEQNFLKMLPQEIDDFIAFMKMNLSMMFTNGAILAKGVATNTDLANGVLGVTRVERFEVDQLVRIKDSNTGAGTFYVTGISLDLNTITLSASRGGAAADLAGAGYAIADGVEVYLDSFDNAANQLTSLKSSLLSATNGGSSALYGVTKTLYPYLQAINVSGSDILASNILDKVFAAQTQVRIKGKGNPNTIVCSYKHLGSMLANLEIAKGAYRQASEPKASLFGWTEVLINGVKGSLKVVAIQEMDDDWMAILDMAAMKIYSNGFIKKRQGPDGLEYFVIRDEATDGTGGYKYVVDICFFGDLVLERPSRCGIIHTISY